MKQYKRLTMTVLFFGIFLTFVQPTLACGGLFCQNIPVDQAAERIIFTVDPGVVSAYVQINYTGNAPDFAWVVPVPSVPEVDVAEIDSFTDLQAATDPVFMLPPVPDCVFNQLRQAAAVQESAAAPMAEADVTVFSSGEAGPYAFDVVGTETGNANALIDWLNENNYRITPAMEPLVFVYVEEGMVFLAMKLRPEQGIQDIQPVKMTYQAERPAIPIRLTAVAATPNMGIYTWIFGRTQAEAQNYGSVKISNDDISVTNFLAGSTDYLQLVGSGIDRFGGRAFITEYAQPSNQLQVVDPLLQELRQQYPFVTRLYGQISPEEMTIDPIFDFNSNLPEVSNIRDLTYRTDLYPCQDNAGPIESLIGINFSTANRDGEAVTTSFGIAELVVGGLFVVCLLGFGALVGGGIVFLSRRK